MPEETVKPSAQSAFQQVIQRDGTSQAERMQAALDPAYVLVDERSLKDLLAFAREYARELQYFDVENGRVQAVDDWSNFLRGVENNKELDLDEVVAFMQEPAKFAPEQARSYTRPHFVLFLTFLQLLGHAKDQLNMLTRRHLDFYYQQVLRMSKRPSNPDQVNVLVDLAPDSAQFLLPAGTALNAGTDSLGQDLAYRTDRDIVVNQAQVAGLRSIYIDQRVTGIREARGADDGPSPRDEAVINMLNMALGDPNPGDPMPNYTDEITVDYGLLEKLYELLTFVDTGMSMQFDEFRQLMRLRTQRDIKRDQVIEEWNRINAILEKVLRTRTDKSNERFEPQNLSDFEANVKEVLGNPEDYERMFDGIPQVKDIYDAFGHRTDQHAQDRIRERLYLPVDDKDVLKIYQTLPGDDAPAFLFQIHLEFSSRLNKGDLPETLRQEFKSHNISLSDDVAVAMVEKTREWLVEDAGSELTYTIKRGIDQLDSPDSLNFTALMQIKVRIDREWEEINRILAEAGQKKGTLSPPFTFPTADPTDFAANLNDALSPLDFPDDIENIDAYYAVLMRIEQFFFMSAENFAYLMALAQKWVNKKVNSTPSEWNTAYKILADSHKAKVHTAHSERLKEARQEKDFVAMAGLALSENPAEETVAELIAGLTRLVPTTEARFLDQISPRLENNKDVTEKEWAELYRIAEIVQRTRLGEPLAQKVEWLNLYPAEDATAVEVKLGLEAETGSPRWSTFGQGQPAINPDVPPPASFGWAISSPLLALSQGKRTISLTLGFQSDHFDDDMIRALFLFPTSPTNTPTSDNVVGEDESPLFLVEKDAGPFRIELTTEKGWIEPDILRVGVADYHELSGVPKSERDTLLRALKFELTFKEDREAIGPLADEEAQPDTRWPVLRMILRPIFDAEQGKAGTYFTPYQRFKDLVLVRTHVGVSVSELTEFQLENDETVLDSTKPFEPFGTSPSVGSRFYLGHPEIVQKKLDRLDFQVEWMGAPEDMQEYYKTYYSDVVAFSDPAKFTETFMAPVTFTAPVTNQTFTVRVGLMDKRLDVQLADKTPLFDRTDARKSRTILFGQVPAALREGRSEYVYDRPSDVVMGEDLRTWSRYWQWELNSPDFQHEAFPTVVAKKSLALATAISNKSEGGTLVAEHYQVNPPYTPTIKKLSLDYAASAEIRLEAYKPGAQIDRIFHVHPFGNSEIQLESPTRPYFFLPQFDYEGELFIEIREAHPPQNLSLLFQMAEGSANPDLDPVPVQWSYLSGNRWLNLDDGNLLRDTTRGLINSGIISFALESVQPSTLFPSDLYWLRAAIPRDSNSVCDTVAIHTQAVSATFFDQDNAPDHLSRPLSAESIADLVDPLPEVTGIRQPYTSYGGKMAEQDRTFYTRISERLRHKHRALTLWDYEHMILERFPQVYRAKCLPADPDDPGRVEIIVIPDVKNKLPFNPFEPKAPSDLIADIETYLAGNIPPFAAVKVNNAHYVPVKVRFAVRFLPGYNEGYSKQRLNEELNRFLSPWAYEDGADIVIGGRIYANVIINFIEERPYVDYVAGIKLFSSEDGRTFKLAMPSSSEGYWVETDRPDGVLVAARQHEIDMISEAGYEEETFTGINYMKIELDFIVG